MTQLNHYSAWKYLFITFVIAICTLYALPNIYGEDPSVQIAPEYAQNIEVDEILKSKIDQQLKQANIAYTKADLSPKQLLLRFKDTDTQWKAYSLLKDSLQGFTVAQNLNAATPDWLQAFGAKPMYLGLDLRGGVHFLMQVDMETAITQEEEKYVGEFRTLFRENKVHYKSLANLSLKQGGGIQITFNDAETKEQARKLAAKNYAELTIVDKDSSTDLGLFLSLTEKSLKEFKQRALEQNTTTLRNRVNELGVAEPVIQRQGDERVVVQLPGVQDPAEAKKILGATATLEFRLVDEDSSTYGSRKYPRRDGGPDVNLKRKVIVTGDQIVDAAASVDQKSGSPATFVTLDGKGAKRMYDVTSDNVGKLMAVVFIETTLKTKEVNGEKITTRTKKEEVINVATIREAFGKRFQVTGLQAAESRNLALLLRAGALKAPMEIIEERTIGPSLGQESVDRGMLSITLGFVAVLVFMALRYSMFGMIANFALLMNVIVLVALLSLLQATLTLPGIAGIVLTLGMAVDANVLIFERIREELFQGSTPQASIHAGYEKAFGTIADSNITTLIAAIMLFGFGTGPIKGFAITLSLGIITSMFTAIIVSRAIVNYLYGGKKLQGLPV